MTNNRICLGIIGNFKGHLSGAENIAESNIPNGIFVIHCDHDDTITMQNIAKYPQQGTQVDIEPEFVIKCRLSYENGKVTTIEPQQITIGNDFTIRQLSGSEKISQRKAWGEKSKGINTLWWPIESFTPDVYGKDLKLISYIERDGIFHCATPLVDCSETKVFCRELLDWTIDSINNQPSAGMYEEILPVLVEMGYPKELVLYTGAPDYTPWGHENYIQLGDKIHIAAFNGRKETVGNIEKMLINNAHENNNEILSFYQTII